MAREKACAKGETEAVGTLTLWCGGLWCRRYCESPREGNPKPEKFRVTGKPGF